MNSISTGEPLKPPSTTSTLPPVDHTTPLKVPGADETYWPEWKREQVWDLVKELSMLISDWVGFG